MKGRIGYIQHWTARTTYFVNSTSKSRYFESWLQLLKYSKGCGARVTRRHSRRTQSEILDELRLYRSIPRYRRCPRMFASLITTRASFRAARYFGSENIFWKCMPIPYSSKRCMIWFACLDILCPGVQFDDYITCSFSYCPQYFSSRIV